MYLWEAFSWALQKSPRRVGSNVLRNAEHLDPPVPPPPIKRQVRGIHPLVAYAFVLRYGRRIPGPIPGSMPSQGHEPPV